MDSWIWNQVGLEFCDINVQGTIESQWSSQRWNNLRNKSVQVSVSWSFDIKVSSADIINGFVVEHNGNISVFQKGVGWKDWVVWFNDSGWNLWGWINGETEFWFLSIIDWESFQKEGSQTWTCSTSDGVEHQETLKTGTVISELSDSVQTQVNDFLTNGVMSSGKVVGGVFLSGDKLFWVEQLSVSTSSDLINNGGFQIQENGSWDVLSSSGFREESVEGIITTTDSFIRWHLSVWLNSVFKTEQLPAGITDLDTSLTNVYGDDLSHAWFWI